MKCSLKKFLPIEIIQLIVVVMGASFALNESYAGANNRTAYGGNGGTDFILDCGDDAVLVGYHGRAGKWTDKIGIKCRKVDAMGNPTGNLVNPISGASGKGGNGGNSFTKYCPSNSAVTTLDIWYGWYVTGFQSNCGPASNGAYATRRSKGIVGYLKADSKVGNTRCTNNKPARGIYGKSGSYVDKIGLICHSGSTPRMPVHEAPSHIAASSSNGQVRVTFRDNSEIETRYFVMLWSDSAQAVYGFANRRSGRGATLQHSIPPQTSATYNVVVCAENRDREGNLTQSQKQDFNAVHGHSGFMCTNRNNAVNFVQSCMPTVTRVDQVGAGTGKVYWSYSCANPSKFDIYSSCGHRNEMWVASANGNDRDETFSQTWIGRLRGETPRSGYVKVCPEGQDCGRRNFSC